MIELPTPRQTTRLWIVSEVENRWITAVRRFAPELMPGTLIPSIAAASSPKARALLSGIDHAVVLWEVRRESLAACCDSLAAVAISAPQVLQLLAVSGLSNRERIVLSEFRCSAMIRQPEDLPGLSGMIHDYFAATR